MPPALSTSRLRRRLLSAQVIQDLYEECGKYGQLVRVIVPRPPVPASVMELFGSNNYGKVGVGLSEIRLPLL